LFVNILFQLTTFETEINIYLYTTENERTKERESASENRSKLTNNHNTYGTNANPVSAMELGKINVTSNNDDANK